MGCGGSALVVELDLKWTPTELGDYILDLEENKIKAVFENKPEQNKRELNEILLHALWFYLVYKNQCKYVDSKPSSIENQMQSYRKDDKLRDGLLPISKWMLEHKIPKSQKTIKPDDFAETVGKWFDPYVKAMSSL